MSRTPEPIAIRTAKADDYDRLRTLWSAAGLSIRATGRDSREAWIAQLAHFPTLYLVAEADGAIVGSVLGTHDWRKGWINRLVVHPDYRRRGLGQRLIATCESALAELGIEIYAALIEEGNDASVAVFEKAGYVADVPVHYYRKRVREDI